MLLLVVFLPMLPAYEFLVYTFFGTWDFWWEGSRNAPVTTPVAILLLSGKQAEGRMLILCIA